MSARLELLEKLVNKCNLSTQRATHTNVITVGTRVLDDVEYNREQRFQNELDEAVANAEARAERDKQRALMRLQNKMEDDRSKALEEQKNYFHQVAERVSEQRDRLEAERIKDLRDQLEDEKQEALRQQWQQAEREKEAAVDDACQSLTQRLNKEHKLDKELSIGSALKQAREGFRQRLKESIDRTTEECEQAAREEAARVSKLHSQDIQRHEIRYGDLRKKYTEEHQHRQNVESDFLALQTDYQRFMDYTDGKFHSDYLMSLRRHGMRLSEKRMSDVSEYTSIEVKDIALPRLTES